MATNFFKDLKVLELAGVLAGPSVGMFFAELGADVTKIENKRAGGDVTRKWKTPGEDPNASVSAYYASVNYNKKSLFLDLTNESDQQALQALVADSDVIITNFKAGDAERYGVGHDQVKKINDQAIYVALTGFASQPERTAFDVILQAETGYMSMNGTPESGPVKIPLAIVDLFAGHQLKEAILIAMLNKTKTGKGAYIHLSLEEAAISSLANQASNWLMGNHLPQRIGSWHPNIAPYGETFTCRDGKSLVLAVGSDRHFQALCEVLDIPELADDMRFNTNANRVENREELYRLLNEQIGILKSEAIMNQLEERQVPAAIIKNIKEVFENEVAQKLILEQEEVSGQVSKRVSTTPFQITYYT